MTEFEGARANELRVARTKAENLFREIDVRMLIRPGITESKLNENLF
jgi:Xaa-Pro dipeptidase